MHDGKFPPDEMPPIYVFLAMFNGWEVLILPLLVHMRSHSLLIQIDASSAEIASFQLLSIFLWAHSSLFKRFFSDSIETRVGYGLVYSKPFKQRANVF